MTEDLTGSICGEPHTATFAILCFNQERFIGDALNAALRQTGDPIEIIVSDDASSDNSLAAAQAVADRYRGPHRVVIRRTQRNLGTLHHLFDIATIATGDLLVVGAADDLARSDRVETLVAARGRDGATAFFSAYEIIDKEGAVVEEHHRFDDRWLPIHDYLPGRALISIHGASSAYDRATLLSLPRPVGRILFEDTWLTLILTLFGHRITFVDEPLVAYRRHDTSITNFGIRERASRASIEAADANGRRSASAYLDAIASFAAIADDQGRGDAVAMHVMQRDLRFFQAQVAWPELGRRARMLVALVARQPWMRRWAFLRLLSPGLRVAVARLRRRGST